MITIDQYPDHDPPKVVLRFNYVAPTHDVCALLEREGKTEHFRTVTLQYHASADDMSAYAVDHLMDLAADELLRLLGKQIADNPEPLPPPVVATRADDLEAPDA